MADEKSLVDKFTETTKEWAENTSGHGIPNIVRANNKFIRIMWVLFFLASLTYCSYTIIKSLIDYAKYETKVQITVIRDSPTEFPAVTICNLNPYDYYFEENKIYIDGLLDANGISYIDLEKYLNNSTPREAIQNVFTKLKRLVAIDVHNRSEYFRRNIGFELQTQMLLSCTFNKITCHASQFSYFWSNDYGNCYTFNNGIDAYGNSSKVYKTSKSGSEFGLQLELLVGNPIKDTQFAYKSGIFLIVHNKSTPSFRLTSGIDIPTGFETYVPVTRTFHTKLNSPYSECMEDMNKFEKLSDYSKTLSTYMKELNVTDYNQELCYDLCFQDQLTAKCNCCEINIPILKNLLYCVTDKDLVCLSQVNELFSTSNVDELCQNSCPDQCESVDYDLSGHTATYPTRYYYDQLVTAAVLLAKDEDAYRIIQESVDALQTVSSLDELELVKMNIVKVTVNYNDLKYTKIEETPSMTFETLLGVLGGQLGLFIGISFLSLVELVEIIIVLFYVYREHKNSQNALAQNARARVPQYGMFPFQSIYGFRY